MNSVNSGVLTDILLHAGGDGGAVRQSVGDVDRRTTHGVGDGAHEQRPAVEAALLVPGLYAAKNGSGDFFMPALIETSMMDLSKTQVIDASEGRRWLTDTLGFVTAIG